MEIEFSFKNKYRIVRDDFAGYEAQVKFWWFPFVWFQMGHPTNTHGSMESAERYIKHEAGKVKIVKEVEV